MKNIYVNAIDNEDFIQLIESYDPSQIVVIMDDNTEQFLEELHQITDLNIDAIQLPAGESHKNIQTLAGIWRDLTDNNFRRDGLIINLGGGVITDIGGFAAATYKRGVDFINIPTTLLAMVDAAIGGKTGIDFFDFKNQIGVIKNPVAVFCDVKYLNTLSKDELLSGFAEVLKHGLIANKKYWNVCTFSPFEDLNWKKIVQGSIEIKSNIVAADPEEKNQRKLLNFGHTIGHAIESLRLEQYKPILHGFAIAAGMIVETRIAVDKQLLSAEEQLIITSKIDSYFSRVLFKESEIDALIDKMKNDKKNNSNAINFTLLTELGAGIVNQTATEDEIRNALKWYLA